MPSRERRSLARPLRFLTSIGYLVLMVLVIIGAGGSELGIPPTTGALLVIGFYAAEGLLIVFLAAGLYRQHGLERMRFGIGSMMLMTAAIALVMGFGSVLSHLSINPERVRTLVIFLTVITATGIFPLLSIAEALVVWRRAIFNRSEVAPVGSEDPA